MLTDKNLVIERPHSSGAGVQRIYRFPCGNGLSAINTPIAHTYPYAWELAVLVNVSEDGEYDCINYSTPLTSDVKVFMNDENTNAFIRLAERFFKEASNLLEPRV